MIARRLLAPAIFATTASPTLADVPYATDDALLIEPTYYEASIAFDAVAIDGHDPTIAVAAFDYGLANGVQIGLAAALPMPHAGSGRLSLGQLSGYAKIELTKQRGARPGLVFEPTVGIPFGDRLRSKPGLALPLYTGVERGPWSVYGGGGYAFGADVDGGDHPFGGIVLSRTLSPRLAVGAELDGRGPGGGNPWLGEIGAGVAVDIGQRLTLAAAAYRTLAHRSVHGDGRAVITLRYAR